MTCSSYLSVFGPASTKHSSPHRDVLRTGVPPYGLLLREVIMLRPFLSSFLLAHRPIAGRPVGVQRPSTRS